MSTAEFIPPKPVQRWRADDYASKGRFVSELARPVVDLLAPKRGERILDLGCGDGGLTEGIAASGADVLGADLNEALLPAAAPKGLKVQRADGHALPFKGEFDAVFTNAALLHRALKPRGRFVGEFGGHGNVAAIATAIRAVSALHHDDPAKVAPWFFSSVAEYRRLLEQGGFTVKSIVLVPRPTPLEIRRQGWLETFGRSFFDQFAEPERSEVFSEVLDLLRPALCDADGVGRQTTSDCASPRSG